MKYLSCENLGSLLSALIETAWCEMAAGRLLNPPDPLQLSSGNVPQNWKRFKQKWSNYELAIGKARKEDPIQVATFLTVISDKALDVYNAFT